MLYSQLLFVLSFIFLFNAVVPSAIALPLTRPTSLSLAGEQAEEGIVLNEGWWDPEPDARWTGRGGGGAAFSFEPAPGFDYDVRIMLTAVPEQVARNEVKVLANGRVLANLDAAGSMTLAFRLEAEGLTPPEPVRIEIHSPVWDSSASGFGPDTRLLGIKVSQIRVIPRRRRAEDGVRRVAVFHDGAAPGTGAPAAPERIVAALEQAGIPCAVIGPHELADPALFHTGAYDVIILTHGRTFPLNACENFVDFLTAGGSFVSTGGYVFADLYNRDGTEDLLSGGRFDVEPTGWSAGTPWPDGVRFAWDDGEKAVRARVAEEAPVTWYDYVKPITLPKPDTTVRIELRAKTQSLAGGYGAYGALCCYDALGKRVACIETGIINGSSDWVSVEGTGVVPANAVTAQFGLIVHGHGIAWFDDAHVMPYAAPMNTASGIAADFLEVDPMQIGAFDAGYPLKGAETAHADENQFLIPHSISLTGPFEGWAAVGKQGETWYCTAPDRSRYTPLLQTRDAFGRAAGPLAGVMINHGGPYERSIWAFFGAENTDLFSGDYPGMEGALADLASAIRRKTFVWETRSQYACYHDGETVRLSANVSNWGSVKRELTVRFEVIDVDTGEAVFQVDRSVEADAEETKAVTSEWTPQGFNGDLYQVQATLLEDGHPVDREGSNGFVVWKEATFRSLPSLAIEDNALVLDGKPRFLLGTQQFWSSLSIRNSSPLAIADDFRAMRDMGVRLSRSFMMWALRPEDEEERFRDMMVYLAHKYGVVMFYEGIADCPAATDDYVKELARADYVAQRYGDLPLFCVDLRNEPVMRIAAGERQQRWIDAYVRRKYAGTPPYGDPVVQPLSNEWGDLASADLNACLLERFAEWSRVLSDRLHANKPELLVSVGFLQNVTGANATEYPACAAEGLDFMNRHFYGPLPNFPAQFKEIDLRALGLPPSVGEFGSKTHPGKGGNYESPEAQFNRYLFVTHYALGLGGIFASNWHWRDPWENIFPYGLQHQDTLPKPVAKLYRAMALLFASLRPEPELPMVYVVLPDAHRIVWHPHAQALYTAMDELMNQRVEFGIIPESRLASLPSKARVLFYPLPFLSTDAVVEELHTFVERGGTLYMSGDIGYDDRFERSYGDWLPRLAGVAEVVVRTRGLEQPLPEKERVIAEAAGLTDYDAQPVVTFGADASEALYTASRGGPVAVRHAIGTGTVVYTADPVELRSEDLSASGLYRYVLRAGGILPNSLQPDSPDLHCLRVPTQDGTAWIVYDRRPVSGAGGDHLAGPLFTREETRRVAIDGAGIVLTTAPMKPGFAHVLVDGRLVALETQGAVWRQDKLVLDTDTHVVVLALDGRDLPTSEMLALVALHPGRVRVAVDAPGLKAQTGCLEGAVSGVRCAASL